jgi:calcineurin-like phosphoesterase family protein
MKFLIAIFLVSYSVSAQEIEFENESQVAPIVIENNLIKTLKDVDVNFLVKDDKTSIARKKSYKNIIEKTLSGEKYLIFNVKREVKTC